MSIALAAGGVALAIGAAAPIISIGIYRKIKDSAEKKSVIGVTSNAAITSEISDMSYYDPTPFAGPLMNSAGGISAKEIRTNAINGICGAAIGEAVACTRTLKEPIWTGDMSLITKDLLPGQMMMKASIKANSKYNEPPMKAYSEAYKEAYNDTPIQGFSSAFISWAMGNKTKMPSDLNSVIRSLPATVGQRLHPKIVIKQAMRMATADGSPRETEQAAAITAGCLWLAASGASKESIEDYVSQYYELNGITMKMADSPKDCSVAVPYAVSTFLDCPTVSTCAACIAANGPDYAEAAAIACALAGAACGIDDNERKWIDENAPWIISL